MAIRLLNQIEKLLQVSLPPTTLLKHRTIQEFAQVIDGNQEAISWTSLVPLKASGSKAPVFCIHMGGEHAFHYNKLSKHLDDRPVYVLQPLNFEDDPQYNNVHNIAAHYIDEIKKVYEEPCILIGYCYGVTIAFEMYHQLKKRGEELLFFGAIDSTPMLTVHRPPEKDTLNNFAHLVKELDFKTIHKSIKRRLKPITTKLEELLYSEEEARLANSREHAVCLNTVYEWQPLEDAHVSLIRSTETVNSLDNTYDIARWEAVVPQGVHVHEIEGHHRTLFEEPEVQVLANKLNNLLDQKV